MTKFSAALLGALLIAAPAAANVTTFAGITLPATSGPYTENGITVVGFSDQILSEEPGTINVDTWTTNLTFTGGLFDLLSMSGWHNRLHVGETPMVFLSAYDAADNLLYNGAFTLLHRSPIFFTGWTAISRLEMVGSTDANIDAVEVIASVPEPASWALMIAGFAVVGTAMRRQLATKLRFT